MEESTGAQYALQVALQTMKERCKQLQQRNTVLEEENVSLRSRCQDDLSLKDLSEVDVLKERIAQLTEQKSQLMQNVLMVSTENRQLWNRLSKLTQANETLGGHLSVINNTLKQHNVGANITAQNATTQHAPLIRSKTFTQETPANKIIPKVEKEIDNMSLEDISLKLINTLAKEKSELENQCTQMMELQNDEKFINPIGFTYPEDVEDSVLEEFGQHISSLKSIKELLLQQNAKLQKELINMKVILTEQNKKPCKECDRKAKLEKVEEVVQLNSLTKWVTTEPTPIAAPVVNGNTTMVITNSIVPSAPTEKDNIEVPVDKICPMCSKTFFKEVKFQEFQNHVESHFLLEDHLNSIDHFEFL